MIKTDKGNAFKKNLVMTLIAWNVLTQTFVINAKHIFKLTHLEGARRRNYHALIKIVRNVIIPKYVQFAKLGMK